MSHADIQITVLQATTPGFRIETSRADAGAPVRFVSLAAALAQLRPDVLHIQAGPETRLATEAARLCGRRIGLVIEAETGRSARSGLVRSAVAGLRARRSLARADSIIVRQAGRIAALRARGFRGVGIVAGPPPQRLTEADRAARRQRLNLPDDKWLVLGWAGALGARSGIFDVLEALAICDQVCLVLPAAGLADQVPAYQETLDRADALELLPRIRFLPAAIDLAACAAVIEVSDAVIVPSARSASARADALAAAELAGAHGVPILHPGTPVLASAAGSGGWAVPLDDPDRLAAALATLQADATRFRPPMHPSLQPGEDAAATKAAAAFTVAIHAAFQARRATGAPSNRRKASRPAGLASDRQPSGT